LNKPKLSASIEDGLPLREEEAFNLPLTTLSEKLKTNLETGLTEQAAAERLKKIGQNVVPKVKSSLLKVYLEPLLNWLIIIYVFVSVALALIALFFLPELWLQISLWLPIILINIIIIVVQSARAQTELNALSKLSAPKSQIIRDNKVNVSSSENIVPGDVIFLKQGDMVPADSRIISSASLRINEAALTGESIENEKFQENLADYDEKNILRKKNLLFMGTFVVTGTATALVVETAGYTQLGLMASKLGRLSFPEISVRKRINKLARNLALMTLLYLILAISYSIFILYSNGEIAISTLVASDIAKSLTTSLSILPINVPLLITTIMLTGALFMAQYDIVIRNLNAIECLGRVSILCSDKTGTITKNRQTVQWIYLPTTQGKEQLYYIKSSETSPEGRIIPANLSSDLKKDVENSNEFQDKKPIKIISDTPLEHVLEAALLNNDIFIIKDEKRTEKPCDRKIDYTVSGDATDTAMLCLFERSNLDPATYRERFKVVHTWPLDPKTRLITSVFKDIVTEDYFVFTKGATETFLQKCKYVLNEKNEPEPFNEENKKLVADRVNLFSSLGQRIISFGFHRTSSFDPQQTREDFEKNLVYLGLVAITDPPREGVYEAVCELKLAGIKPIMITGDSPATAQSIAKEVGIAEEGQLVVEGSQIKNLSDEDFMKAGVFARISPEDKMAIVSRYQQQKCVVAMTGDGVNDAPAISKADVGIAMGLSGTDVARQTAHVVLADDSFNSIVKGIREGRGVFEKIQNIVFFYIAVNLAEALIYFSSSFISGFYLLGTWQLVYIFGTAHFIPPMALILDKIGKEGMKEKPRSKADFISGHRRTELIIFTLALAMVLSVAYVVSTGGFLTVFAQNKEGFIPSLSHGDSLNAESWEQAKARTMFLSVAIIAESFLVLSLRRLSKPIYRSLKEDSNWKIWPFILAIPIVQLVLMYIPAIQYFFVKIGINLQIIQLAPIDWLVVLALALTPIFVLELVKIAYIKVAPHKLQN
jgi:P-type Ca2+ transporter type 2C